MALALVLTRQPKNVFTYQTNVAPDPKRWIFEYEQGRFGTLILLKADQITEVKLLEDNEQEPTSPSVPVPGGRLLIACSGELKEISRYTTIERLDHHMVSLKRKPEPYKVIFESNNSEVIKLPGTHGNCFRVRGGRTLPEQGILIHAAPHVGWLTGCISPRMNKFKAGAYLPNTDLVTNTTFAAMEELFSLIGKKEQADLFVTDS